MEEESHTLGEKLESRELTPLGGSRKNLVGLIASL